MGLLSILILNKINSNIFYSLIFLTFLIIPFLFIKNNRYIKLYSALCCLLLFIINIFYNAIPNHFSKTFAIAIPFICLLCSLWILKQNIYNTKLFCSSLVIFCYFAIEAFITNNIFFIYAYIEMSLIPMTVMLFVYNSNYYLKIIYQYLFYTFIGSIFILIGLIILYNNTYSVLLSDIYKVGVTTQLPLYILAIGTAIKLPVFPFYYWVPSVHGKSQGICSVLLSSIILKFSSLILVKIIVPLFNIYSYNYLGYYIATSLLVATLQMLYVQDLKVIFAYSSVIHMGLYTFILLYFNNIKYFTYGILQHTFTMAFSFLLLDLLKENYKSLDVNKIVITNKYHLVLLLINILIIIGFPLTWGFVAELISLMSVIHYSIVIASIISLSLLVYTSYFIYVLFTIFKHANIINNKKSNTLQYILLIILISINMLFGIMPKIYI